MTTNINGSDDPFYRYKRPIVLVKHSVNFTEITNLGEVSRALGRTPELLMAYLQNKFATQSNGNSLRGHFSAQDIESHLRDFTKLLVLCGRCNNPETRIKTKRGLSYLKCESCGSNTDVVLGGKLDKLSKHF